MLELKALQCEPNLAIDALQRRGIRNAASKVHDLLTCHAEHKATQTQLNILQAKLNAKHKTISSLYQADKAAKAKPLIAGNQSLKTNIQQLKVKLAELDARIHDQLVVLPNLPLPEVPLGRDAAHNCITYQSHPGPLPTQGRPHWELAEQYRLIDFQQGAKLAQAGFPVYHGQGAQLQRALINFFLDEAHKAGYHEVQPPHLVNAKTAYGTGQLPDKEGQMYKVSNENLYLIPTSEVPLTNLYSNTIIPSHQLPIKLTAYSACFRREAGSWGSHVRGLNRLHQFDKVELVQLTKPDQSVIALDGMCKHVGQLLHKLGLPYRIVQLCTGDLGMTAAMTYDFEVFAQGQGRWLEASSVSTCQTYQAHRMHIRYKDKKGKKELVHTLNGSALALPRLMAALLEYYQTPKGIQLPEVLIPYTRFERIQLPAQL